MRLFGIQTAERTKEEVSKKASERETEKLQWNDVSSSLGDG